MAEGIDVRMGRDGRKSYRVRVWSQRDRKRIAKSFRSLAEAKGWRADALVALREGTLRAPDPRTVREASAVWLSGAREGRVRDRSGRAYKPSTIRTYAEKLDGYVLPALGDYRLSELRRRDVQDVVDELVADGLSASSVRNTIDPLRAIYRRAIQREQVAINPTSNLDLPSSRRKPVRVATPVEAEALLDALPNGERAPWATAFYAGLRRGELQALRCSAIDLGASTIRVAGSWDQYEGAIDPKSDTSTRAVPLLATLRDYLDEHLLATGRSGHDLALGRTTSDPFVPSTLRSRALAAWEGAGLDPIGLHECRHTFASLLIDSGENPKAVQEFMGHSSIKVTFDLYGHLFPGSRDEARRRMDAYLEEALAVSTDSNTRR
jgi:integrase